MQAQYRLLTLAFHHSSCYSFGMTSGLYAEFDSPLPTLILHSENGLGIFVALAPDPMRRVHSTRMEKNEFVIHFSDHEVRFPIRQNAMGLVQAKGAVFAITDERGLPWFTQEFGVVRSETWRAAIGVIRYWGFCALMDEPMDRP